MTPTQAGELAGNKLSFGLLEEERRPTDYIHGQEERLGGSIWEKKQPVLEINGEKVVTHEADEPEHEFQRKAFETNACVSYSYDNCFEYLGEHECKKDPGFKLILASVGLIKNGKVNVSDRRTAKGSGTDPDAGNYVSKVDDYGRNFLFCPEDLYPYTETMGRAEYYQELPLEIANYGEKVKPLIKVETKYVSSNTVSTPDQLWDALQYSPIWASVDGFDQRNADNIIEGFSGYTHRITIRKGVYGKYWEIHDHYQSQFKKYAWNYPFGNAKIMQLIILKKTPMEQLVKFGTQSAVYLQLANGDLFGIADSQDITGGSLLKKFSGTYGNAGIVHLPIEDFDPKKVVGEIAAKRFSILSTIFN